jgi:hypothetical protein
MSKVNGRRKNSPDFVGLPLDVTAFRGQWVALHPTTYKVIGHGASLEEARQSRRANAAHRIMDIRRAR